MGWDVDEAVVSGLAAGKPPVAEPGLADLVAAGLGTHQLSFTTDVEIAVKQADVVWVTVDTPVDANDQADVESVIAAVARAMPHMMAGAVVLVSSQLPVGSTARLEKLASETLTERHLSFAVSPENLRLGKAIEVFSAPDRIVVGVRDDGTKAKLTALLAPITDRIEWMSVESAEMTKHAINAFLATSVTLTNEIAAICERVGADARQVERGLRTESRIGPRAYVSPGGAFAGGTLARDVAFLRELGERVQRPTPLLDGVAESNSAHRQWASRRLASEFDSLVGRRIAVWGLTYKPGTDTLRRSEAVTLCLAASAAGATVVVHDPAVGELPPHVALAVRREQDPLDAAAGADALVVATEWPVYRSITADALAERLRGGLVIDANRFLGSVIGNDTRFRLVAVGAPGEQ